MPIGKKVGSRSNLKSMIASGNNSDDDIWRIKGDETARIRFLTEPSGWSQYREHYDGAAKGNRFIPCIGRDEGCRLCDDGNKPNAKFLAAVVDQRQGKARALVITPGIGEEFYQRWAKEDTVMDRTYEISRTGTTMEDTKYRLDWESPSKFNARRYEVPDLEELLQEAASGEGYTDGGRPERDDEEPPWARVKKKTHKKTSMRRAVVDDEAEEDEDEDETPRRPLKKVSGLKRKSRDEEDEPRRPIKKVAPKKVPKRRLR